MGRLRSRCDQGLHIAAMIPAMVSIFTVPFAYSVKHGHGPGVDGTYLLLSQLQAPIRRPGHGVPVAHTYNPSYSGGRDQGDCSMKPAWANSL
jgi:hypothetical protein